MTSVENLTTQQLENIIKRAPQNIWTWTQRQMEAWVELQGRRR